MVSNKWNVLFFLFLCLIDKVWMVLNRFCKNVLWVFFFLNDNFMVIEVLGIVLFLIVVWLISNVVFCWSWFLIFINWVSEIWFFRIFLSFFLFYVNFGVIINCFVIDWKSCLIKFFFWFLFVWWISLVFLSFFKW